MSETANISNEVFEKIRRDAEEKRKVREAQRQKDEEFWSQAKGIDSHQTGDK